MRTVPADLRARGAAVEAVVGAVWWAVGTSVLPAGPGTLLLAAGLAVAFGLVRAGRRYPAYGERLSGEAARAMPRAAIAAAVLIVLAVAGLGVAGWGELTAPLACAIVGGCYLWAAGRTQRRTEAPIGLVLIGLAGLAVPAALGSAGETLPRALTGLGGGLVFWTAATLRLGLHRRLRARLAGSRAR